MTGAVVLHSGGLDSSTLLYFTIEQGHDVRTLSFNYGQRHMVELAYAAAARARACAAT
jgi:7-cyano-7-deazaguanine synthase